MFYRRAKVIIRIRLRAPLPVFMRFATAYFAPESSLAAGAQSTNLWHSSVQTLHGPGHTLLPCSSRLKCKWLMTCSQSTNTRLYNESCEYKGLVSREGNGRG